MSGEHAKIHRPEMRDDNGVRTPHPVACECGWEASTDDGWDGLAEWYAHVAPGPAPAVEW